MTTRVDHSMLGAGNDLMPKSGGVFTGSVTLAGDATAALHPISKQQLDTTLLPYQKMQLIASKSATGTVMTFSPADGTGIPSWAKKITVSIVDVSTSGTSSKLVRLGVGGVSQATGYKGVIGFIGTTANTTTSAQSSIGAQFGAGTSSSSFQGSVEFTKISDTLWAWRGIVSDFQSGTANSPAMTSGSVVTSDVVDSLFVTNANGTDNFDAGSVSILVEGY